MATNDPPNEPTIDSIGDLLKKAEDLQKKGDVVGAVAPLEAAKGLCLSAGQIKGVVYCLERLLVIKPNEKSYYSELCQSFEALMEFGNAFRAWQKYGDEKNATAPELAKAGQYALFAEHLDEAIRYLEKSLALEGSNAEAWTYLGRCHASLGDKRGATDAFHKALVADPDFLSAYFFLSEIETFEPGNPAFATLEGLKKGTLTEQDESAIGFALGRMYQGIEDYDKAFENFNLGNIATRKIYAPLGYGFNPAATKTSFQLVRSLYSPENRKKIGFAGSPSKKPIFILGMPRSGTTLLEQIMAAHSDISSAGELGHLTAGHQNMLEITKKFEGPARQDALLGLIKQGADIFAASFLTLLEEKGGATPMIIDKTPQNFLQLGLIRVLFPDAKIIHMKRDPMAVGLSIFCSQLSGDWAFAQNLEDIGFYIGQYRSLMAEWEETLDMQIHGVDYEALIETPEAVARGVIEFCGLEWQPECLEFYKKSSQVFTSSVMQVRNPINASAVAKWKHYEKHLGPLKVALKG